VYLEFLILACTIYILAPHRKLERARDTIIGSVEIGLILRKRKIASTLTFLGGCFAATNI